MKTSNHKTPLDDILFKSSKIGIIAQGVIKGGLTDAQLEEMKKLEKLKNNPQGLTNKQQAKYNEFKNADNLTDKQKEKLTDFKAKLFTPKGLTDNQKERLAELKKNYTNPPELTQGAKTCIKEIWLENEKGFKNDVTDKKLRKGLQSEEDAINLISFVDGIMYVKNNKRVIKNGITGECDVVIDFPDIKHNGKMGVRMIHDTKCSWDPITFMSADMIPIYEWQGRAYMYLYDGDIFQLRYCLVDCPPEVLQEEYKKYCFQHNIIDDSLPVYKDLIDQFNRNYLYENSGLYTREERVKTFVIERDKYKEDILLLAVKLAKEYYATITLNMIEN